MTSFEILTKKMRSAQVKYSRDKSSMHAIEALRLEMAIDQVLWKLEENDKIKKQVESQKLNTFIPTKL